MESTREKRGKGIQREVAGRNKLSNNWADFLHDSGNKRQVFSFLSNKLEVLECIEGKQIFTSGTTSVTATGASHYMPECNHEEADTRMLLHLQDALENGATTCLVRTVDTDVIVIIVGKFHYLRDQHTAADVWIAFGTGRIFRYLHINAICNALGREKAIALPIFHSVTGCDTTSTFLGKGKKKSAWDAWKAFPKWKAFPEVTKLTWLVIHMFLSILNLKNSNF